MMWSLDAFASASGDDIDASLGLRDLVIANELGDTRLPDFVGLSYIFARPCLPFKEHDVNNYTHDILDTLASRNERKILVFDNPLYDNSSDRVSVIDLTVQSTRKIFEREDLFSAAFIMTTVSRSFVWIGNYSGYGFMFADRELIEKTFCVSAFTAYCTRSCDFRFGLGGDDLLDKEVVKLDHVWQQFVRSWPAKS
jgi:hypothetical protein